MKRVEDQMGKFSVEVEFGNNMDIVAAKLGHIDPASIRRTRIAGVVDSGSARLVLPKSLAKILGLEVARKVKVRYADGRTAMREFVENVHLELLGRHSVFNAILEPKRDTALIGAIVLEDLDLLIDCTKQTLYPRDPDSVLTEIE